MQWNDMFSIKAKHCIKGHLTYWVAMLITNVDARNWNTMPFVTERWGDELCFNLSGIDSEFSS